MAMYPELMVIPMREELTRLGVQEARSAESVDEFVKNSQGTLMVIVNSICGCAAGKMRPAVRMALQQSAAKPDQSISVFAGQDTEATARAREHFAGGAIFIAVDRLDAGRETDLLHAPFGDRIARRRQHRCRTGVCFPAALWRRR